MCPVLLPWRRSARDFPFDPSLGGWRCLENKAISAVATNCCDQSCSPNDSEGASPVGTFATRQRRYSLVRTAVNCPYRDRQVTAPRFRHASYCPWQGARNEPGAQGIR